MKAFLTVTSDDTSVFVTILHRARALAIVVMLASVSSVVVAPASAQPEDQQQASPQQEASVETVIAFDPSAKEAPESIAIDRLGAIYLSLTATGEIRKLAPNGTQSTLATFPIGSGSLNGLAIDQKGNIYAALASFDQTTHGVWRITPDGASQRLAPLPPNGVPNGLTFDSQGNLFVADSQLGSIWRIAQGSEQAELWLENDLLRSNLSGSFTVGANGLKFWRGELYVSNSDKEDIIRIPVQSNGSAGTPAIYIKRLRTDDFAFDVRGNLYAATGLDNTIMRVSPDGSRKTLLTAEDGLDVPSAVAFGTSPNERTDLFITNVALFSTVNRPSLLKLCVGVSGLPLP